MRQKAEALLKIALNNQYATFREGQWESIEQLLNGNRVLVVQRTGWGKSLVYFLASKLLRELKAGPTLLISPLLALMRNQIEAAQRIGVRARTINSSNMPDWEQIKNELGANQVDVLLISPERLANDDFIHNVLPKIAHNIGLFVIDEAHCISDWGHDFRPDYRRIGRVLKAIPSNVPVLATTATANNRVVHDIKFQLGQQIVLQKGSLIRKSLKLQNIIMPSQAARLAWLAQTLPTLPGSGIIYTLTQRDAERVTAWLQVNHINAQTYHANIPNGEGSGFNKEALEQQLLNNQIKVLVATVALGMGFDKPDLEFVIHFQRPASVVHYYQQVGRAGRAVDEAYGVLLCGEEDDPISNFFIQNAFPPQQHISEVLMALNASTNGLTLIEMEHLLNLQKNQIEKTLKFLIAESPSPVIKIDTKFHINATGASYQVNQENIDAITRIRRDEQQQMRDYMKHSGCLMAFLQRALDDPPTACGKCRNCNPNLLLNETYNHDLANRAGLFLRKSYQPIFPRKKWPDRTPIQHRAQEGRALCLYRDAGWGQLVRDGKYLTKQFSDELVDACVTMLKEWAPTPAPGWITCIPSLNHPDLVPHFASRLANALGLPFFPCIEKTRANAQQKSMANSYHQVKNLDGTFKINLEIKKYMPCLLVDDLVDSRWTFTVASALLRQAGCTAVYPMALALNSPRTE